MKHISVRGARTHNLRDLHVDLPRDQLIVITGLSGSGKSSLAFDTIYAEGQRRYVESLSAYARQFLSMMDKPDVDSIEGLSPAISIEQKSTSHNPRSTVGTVHRDPRLPAPALRARRHSPLPRPRHRADGPKPSARWWTRCWALPRDSAWMLLAPVVRGRKGEHRQMLEQFRAEGFIRVRVDGALHELDDLPRAEPQDQARHRHRRRPFQGAPGPGPALGRKLRDGAAAGRGPGRGGALARGRRRRGANLLRALCLPGLWLHAQRAGTAPVLLQQPARRLPHLRWPGHHLGLRRRPHRGQPGEVAGRRGDSRLGPAQPLLLRAAARPVRGVRHRPGAALPRAARHPARGRAVRQRRPQAALRIPRHEGAHEGAPACIRGHRAQPRAPLPRDRIRCGARGAVALPQRQALRRLRRQSPEQRCRLGTGRPGGTAHGVPAVDPRRRGAFRNPGPARPAWRNRRTHPEGNPPAAELFEQCGPGLPDAGPRRRDAVRRRGAAHPPGQPDRRRPGRRALCAGRALDRPASARQPAPDRHAGAPARPGQHGAGGRAR